MTLRPNDEQPLVLASTSFWRKKMLEDVGIPLECVGSGVDERSFTEREPQALAAVLARAKADTVAQRLPRRWVLGSDQVVTDDQEVWGKPDDPQGHLRRLQSMRGKAHRLISAYCLVLPDGRRWEDSDTTTLWVRGDVSDRELQAYVESGEGSYCAGGYAVEGQGAWLFERVEGDYWNILGMPLLKVLGSLRTLGWGRP